ncbi:MULTISPECIES: DMT family transporter [Pseudomonadaceae]|uniref:Drug/metabolite transporter (DMT)-like permease n=1 Tax=Ectopseudomonas oleovorans TaxID=301 RepID=A0A3D9EWA6_ECTOL|nr:MULTISPECIES: EamA family transporter [Pseudomonas]RED06590.1 drug/metabolite transporter (DMT)-like permease [Pseudomonas oleovorans]
MSATIRQNLDLPGKAFGLSSTYVALGVMVLLWGSSWPVTKLALQSVPPLWLATVRFASAAVCLCLYLALRGQLRLPTRQDLPIIASVGLLQMMTFTGLGMVAMVQIDTSRAVLLAYTTPLWCVLVAWLLFRQAPSRLQLTGLSIGMAGVVVVCSPAELDWTQPGTVKGALFLLLAAVSWALVILHVKRHRWVTSPLALAPWQMLLAVVPLAFAAWLSEGWPTAVTLDTRLLQELFFIGPIATSACFVISAEFGRRISTFAMSTVTLGVPLVGTLASCLAFGATVSSLFVVGLGLVVAGVLVSALAVRPGRA